MGGVKNVFFVWDLYLFDILYFILYILVLLYSVAAVEMFFFAVATPGKRWGTPLKRAPRGPLFSCLTRETVYPCMFIMAPLFLVDCLPMHVDHGTTFGF